MSREQFPGYLTYTVGPAAQEAGPLAPVPAAGMDDCLVVIYTRSGADLGRRIALRHGLTIGRDSSSDLVLDSERLSRRHCELWGYGTTWLIRDLGSTNGTLVNGRRIDEAVLQNGDLIEIGGAILKFLAGPNVENDFHETIYRMTVEDGLTGLSNRRRLLEMLELEVERARRYHRPLGLVLLDLDGFRQLNEEHGYSAGDHLLRELAQRLRGSLRREDIIGRYAVDQFLVLLPETVGDGLEEAAQNLCDQVRSTVIEFDGLELRATASAGAVAFDGEWDLGRFLATAEAAVGAAKGAGGNRVAVISDEAELHTLTEEIRLRVIPPSKLYHAVLAEDAPGGLIAIELEEEALLARLLGEDAVQAWLDLVIDELQLAMAPEDLITRWRPRTLVAAVRHERAANCEETIRQQVVKRFAERPLPPAVQGILTRRLRSTALRAEDVVRHAERSFDLLTEYLFVDRTGTGTHDLWDTLPFPLAAPLSLSATRPTPLARITALHEGIDAALRFIVALALAWLRDAGEDERQLNEILRPHTGRLLDMAASEELAFRLATRLPNDPGDAICQALRALVVGSGRSPLGERLRETASEPPPLAGLRLPLPADEAPQLPPEDRLAQRERSLRELLHKLTVAMRPLSKLRLVSVVDIAQVDRGESGEDITYALRLHRGPLEYFPVVCEDVPARLSREVCYLLRENARPLSLAPLVFSRPCDLCSRVEVMLAEELVLGRELDSSDPHTFTSMASLRRAERVRARGLITRHPGDFDLPRGGR